MTTARDLGFAYHVLDVPISDEDAIDFKGIQLTNLINVVTREIFNKRIVRKPKSNISASLVC